MIESNVSNTAGLIAGGNRGDGAVKVERYLPSADWHIVSSPVTGLKGVYFDYAPNNIETKDVSGTLYYAFGPYNESTDGWDYSTGANAADPFVPGVAYTTSLDGASAGTTVFQGEGINTSTINVPITKSNFGWNGIGNPYTSAINVATFLTDNGSSFDGDYVGLYIWDPVTTGDYEVVITGSIAMGQGFIVRANAGGEVIDFNTAQQEHNTAAVFKSAEIEAPEISLKVENGELQNNTKITFDEESTNRLEPGYDVGKLKGNPNIALYTKLIDGSSDVGFAM